MSSLLYVGPRGTWVRSEIPGEPALLQAPTGDSQRPLLAPLAGEAPLPADHGGLALIVPWLHDGRLHHVHITLGPVVYRNAEPRPLGEFMVLQDRDALIYQAEGRILRYFYDTFTRAEPQLHVGDALECPFCRQAVVHGDLAVRCPVCATVFHHNNTHGSCWLASDRCPICGRATALDLVPSWVPAGFAGPQPADLDAGEDA